jgi:hypothetical protein
MDRISKVQPGCTELGSRRKHLNGKETDAYELVTFKVYRSQLAL